MSLFRRTLLTAAILIFCISGIVAQPPWPKTLLWKITGNGLNKPSYIYGTMHLQDKRLFNFTDSLYHSLAEVEGFALEVDFKELLDSMFTKQIESVEDRFMSEKEIKIDRKKLDKTGDSLLKKFGIHGDQVSKKELKKIRDYRMNKIMQQGEMQTIVDGFLYGLALRRGKWTGGIEDVNDQLNLIDEMGGNLTPDEVFQPDASMKRSLETMINIYESQDLQKLANFSDAQMEKGWRDIILIQRNIKMAKRMDSLSAIRTMFFAIGAAHLPGDSGVITLLRHRGFTVEPVFSSQKISPDKYVKSLSTTSWSTIQDEEKLYSIQMPGNPSEYNMFGQALKMKIFFDLPTMTFYMTGHTIGDISGEKDLDRIFGNIAQRMGVPGNQMKRKNISKGDVHGAESSFEAPQGFYKLQLLQKKNTLFMLMAGSSKKDNLASPDVAHFFNSFLASEQSTVKKDWVKFESREKAFSVMMPGKPRSNKMIDKQGEGSGWTFSTYDLVDNAQGLYYLLQVRDINLGYYLNGDSAYFALYKQDFEKRFDTVLHAHQEMYNGFPSFYMDAVSSAQKLYYKVFYVIRGNRIYTLVVGGQNHADLSDADTYFNSLSLDAYQPAEWTTQGGDGFYTTAPAPVNKILPDSLASEEDKETREHYVSFNPNEVISYELFKEPLSSLFWSESDSLFLEERMASYRSDEDSLIKKEFTWNGQLKGMEAITRHPDNNNLKKIRLFVNGDTLYTMISFIPSQYINDERHGKFFSDFRVANEIMPSIYKSKASQLLAALLTKDSAEFEKAYAVFNQVTFAKTDLPLLHEAMLKQYRESSQGYIQIGEKIARQVQEFSDSSTIGFISRNYHLLDGNNEDAKYTMLEVLAHIHTQSSYDVLKQLLMDHLPKSGTVWKLEDELNDSLELTRQLYPEILQLVSDSIFSKALVGLTADMLDSNLVRWNDVLKYKKEFLARAARILESSKNNDDEVWQAPSWIAFTGRFNDTESNALLQQFLKSPVLSIKENAIEALVKNNQPVNPADMEKVAADKAFRAQLYSSLVTLKKQQLFPSKYASQKSIAESEILELANDENDASAITFIGERIVPFEGVKKKFFLFKVVYESDGDAPQAYLGITGPYSLVGKTILASSDASGIFWKEEYDKLKTDRQLKEHLAEIEAYRKERQNRK